MFVQRQTGTISVWFVVFWTEGQNRLWNLMIPGRFKHVAAFGYSPEARTWVFIDPKYSGEEVLVVPEHEGAAVLSAVMVGATVVRIDARKRRGTTFRLASCCTSAVRDLIGLPGWGVVSPGRLYRDCLRAGGVVICGAPPCVESEGSPRHDSQHGIEPASPA